MHLPQSDLKIRLIFSACALTGFSLSKSKTGKVHFLREMYAYFINSLIALFACVSTAKTLRNSWQEDSQSLAHLVFSARIPLLSISVAVQSIIIQARRKDLLQIFDEFEDLRKIQISSTAQFEKFVKRSNKLTFYHYFFVPLVLTNLVLVALTTLTISAALGYYKDDLFETYMLQQSETGLKSVDASEYLKIMIIFVLGNFKNISQDCLILHMYSFIMQQIALLEKVLTSVKSELLLPFKVSSKLDEWMRYQQSVSRILAKINKTVAPYILLLAMYSASNMCIAAYILAQFTKSTAIMLAASSYLLSSVVKITMICDVGQRLKNEGSSLADAILRIPMTLNLAPSLGITLHSAALDCQRSFIAKCGPFFVLSVDFLTSILGTVLTYFIVLMQLK